ncbi:PD-(D/E)XK nuclease family protein [Mycoplasma sp. Mirounga ES2805-ORL]|uniref:PD-(D/E)XK nuclease family protein n=1 Tax=Mycoplasma sp. Mirounga ES2805-ORL TaxID=754514 RepID=UPI00197C4F65|nr:PD-(D/E)XK nuclease family protein [Mycoplasma sp. Mirounga ES2805-ORL]QSF13750.1 PD-(D/E)XK nuclease family protein [Mycoplasma sp. Mirounga ES2805-ORL]
MSNSDSKKIFLLNKTASGSYTDNNIGFEFINWFVSDNNKKYIYLTSNGNINKKRLDDLQYVFFCESNNGKLKITGYAKIKRNEDIEKYTTLSRSNSATKLYEKKNTNEKYMQKYLKLNEWNKSLIDYIEKNKINYNGMLLHKITDDNKWYEIATFLSLEAEELKIANKEIFLKESIQFRNRLYIDKTSADQITTSTSEIKLSDLIQNDNLWRDAKKMNEIEEDKKDNIISENNIFGILNIVQNEDRITYAIKHMLKNEDKWRKIFNKLGIEITNNSQIESQFRPVNTNDIIIDLYIKTDEKKYIIEHKVNADFHDNQLNKYMKEFENKTKYYVLCPGWAQAKLWKEMSENERLKYKFITYDGLIEYWQNINNENVSEQNKKISNDLLEVFKFNKLEATDRTRIQFLNKINKKINKK